ncbi:ABC1 kinase family protein [Agromyces intestinalis]|nr:AarF/UbiB family protein [Agromyces intestinalis]
MTRDVAITQRGAPIARLVQSFGPGYMKFAQIASTREDMLPQFLREALVPLQDRAVPMSRTEFDHALARSVPGGRTSFKSIDPVAVGAGSIACVYRAERLDGRPVAVKLARPRIASRVQRDVRTIGRVASVVAKSPGLRDVPVQEMVLAVSRAVVTQLDFVTERQSLAGLAERSAHLEMVTVPHPHPDLCSSSAIVMDYVEDLAPSDWRDPDAGRNRVTARDIMTIVFEMLFTTGVVHCDMHPGNLVRRTGGGVALLDAGFVHVIPDEVRIALARFFLNLGFRNGTGCADAILTSCAGVRNTADLTGFRNAIDNLVDMYGGKPADEFNFVDFARRLFAAQRDFGVFASSDFVFPLLALLMVDGTVRSLDPGIDFQAIARPIVFRAVNRAMSLSGTGGGTL